MAVFNNVLAGASGQTTGGAYEIERSLRFNSSDSAYLSRTPASAGNRKTWTWAGWVKRCATGSDHRLFESSADASNQTTIKFLGDKLQIFDSQSVQKMNLQTDRVFRDPSAWYHIVVAVDTTQGTASDTVKVYINGAQETDFSTETYPSQDQELYLNQTNAHDIGRFRGSNNQYLDGYLADIHFIDGQALDPTSFTEVDATTGQLVPKAASISSPNNETIWSDSGSSSATLENGNWGQAFDGTQYVYSGSGPSRGPALSNGSITFSPSGLSGRVVTAGVRGGSNKTYTVNGSAMTFGSSSYEVATIDLGSVQSITSVVGTSTASGVWAQFYWIAVDGVVLVDGVNEYGINGFHLPFSDNSTAAALGTDTSGNGNDWTVNNISVTQAATFTVYGLVTNSSQSITNIASLTQLATNVKHFATGATAHNCLTADFGSVGTWTIYARDYLNSGSFSGTIAKSDNGTSWTSISVGQDPFVFTGRYIQWARSGTGYGDQYLSTALVGSGNDSLVDTPTNYGTDTGAGGEVRGNYCTLNPLEGNGTYTNGNLNWALNASDAGRATFFVSSGKWYWEAAITSGTNPGYFLLGIQKASGTLSTGTIGVDDGYGYFALNGNKYNDTTSSSYGTSFTTNDVIGVAFDADNGTLTFYKNGSSQGTAFSGIEGEYSPYISNHTTFNNDHVGYCNFGQRPFAYPAPSGFKALCTANLDDPVVAQPSTVMDVLLWTGTSTSSARTVSGLSFSPELVWSKARSQPYNNQLWDVVRGTGKELSSNTTAAELTNNQYGYLSAFNSDGFTATPGSTDNGFFNETNTTYVAWCWDAGSSTVTNTDGSITSSVRANQTAGFSIVGWTSNGSSSVETMGTGLGVSPSFVIVKNRDISDNWVIYHQSLGTGSGLIFTTAAAFSSSPYWSVSSSTFGIRQNAIALNGQNCIAYCFAPVDGYSSFGSYTANSTGVFVYLGFKPALLVIKNISTQMTNSQWNVVDTRRDSYNPSLNNLAWDRSNSEPAVNASTYGIDIVSNGFHIPSGNTGEAINSGTYTYIYMAWAESPFKTSRAR